MTKRELLELLAEYSDDLIITVNRQPVEDVFQTTADHLSLVVAEEESEEIPGLVKAGTAWAAFQEDPDAEHIEIIDPLDEVPF